MQLPPCPHCKSRSFFCWWRHTDALTLTTERNFPVCSEPPVLLLSPYPRKIGTPYPVPGTAHGKERDQRHKLAVAELERWWEARRGGMQDAVNSRI